MYTVTLYGKTNICVHTNLLQLTDGKKHRTHANLHYHPAKAILWSTLEEVQHMYSKSIECIHSTYAEQDMYVGTDTMA